jgi:hypothetical protein
MSLISDALKKAQRQRSMPGEGGLMAGGRGHRRGPKSPGPALALGAAALVAIIAVAVAVTITFLQPDPEEIAARINAARTPAAEPAPNAPTPETRVIVLPTLPKSEPAAAAPTVAVENAAPAPSEPVGSPPATPPAVARPSVVIQQYIDDLVITAVALRSVATDNRALIGSRVYAANEIVDRALGLRLVEINETTLVFQDANGARYVRSH